MQTEDEKTLDFLRNEATRLHILVCIPNQEPLKVLELRVLRTATLEAVVKQLTKMGRG